MVALFKPGTHWPGDSWELPSPRAPAASVSTLFSELLPSRERISLRLAGWSLQSSCPAWQHQPKPSDASARRPASDHFDIGLVTRDSWWVWVSEGRGSGPSAGSCCCRRVSLVPVHSCTFWGPHPASVTWTQAWPEAQEASVGTVCAPRTCSLGMKVAV